VQNFFKILGINYIPINMIPTGLPSPGGPDLDSIKTEFQKMKNLGFNMIEICFSWFMAEKDPLAFYSMAENCAIAADQLGMQAFYSFQVNYGWPPWPNSIATQFGTDSTSLTQAQYADLMLHWYLGTIYVGGVQCWNFMLNNYWDELIKNVDSHTSTWGYLFHKEPGMTSGMTLSDMQKYNQAIASGLSALTNKYIVFFNPYNSIGGGPMTGSAQIPAVAPNGLSNLVFGSDCYDGDVDSLGNWAKGAVQTNAVGMMICEYGTASSGGSNTTDDTTFYTTLFNDFKGYGYGSNAFSWRCGIGTLFLLDSSCGTSPELAKISQLASKIIGTGTKPTTLTLKVV
jgi:hypothetical protein